MNIRRISALILAAAGVLSIGSAVAQGFPTKPVRIVVPFPAGGTLDIVARTLAQPLGRSFGHNVIVDNRPGAGTVIGADAVARAPADGHTVLLLGSVFTINAAVRSKLPYDTLKDFAAVARIASIPMLIAVHPSLPVRTIKDLVTFARTRPGQLTYASPGAGTPLHLAMEAFKGLGKTDILHVPYSGGAQAAPAVIGGHATILILPVADIAPHIAVGRLRGLAVTSLVRADILKDVPTLAESGFPGFDMSIWFGTWVPAATPREVVTRLSAEMLRALELPEVKDSLAKQGYFTTALRADEFDTFFRAEVRRYEKIAKAINFKID